MNCEQLEAIVLDFEQDGALDSVTKAVALAHLSQCPRCAALQESWQAAREDLRALGQETAEASAPARVEMRLLQEFRTRHRTLVAWRGAVLAAWALAAAALLVGAVSWWSWQQSRNSNFAGRQVAPPKPLVATGADLAPIQGLSDSSAGVSSGDNLDDFTPLPGTLPGESDQAAILRVRMQRASLGALGLPVNEQRAGDWIQVDLLVGNDGLPQAVRLAQQEN